MVADRKTMKQSDVKLPLYQEFLSTIQTVNIIIIIRLQLKKFPL